MEVYVYSDNLTQCCARPLCVCRYYGVCFLNQLPLRKTEDNLAGHLLGLYFVFFKVCP